MNFINKDLNSIKSLFLNFLFFLVGAFFLHCFSINLSVLIVLMFLSLYVKYFYNEKHLPTSFDFTILTSFALLLVVLTMITFNRWFPYDLSAYSVPSIGYIILVTLLFDNMRLAVLFSMFMALLVGGVNNGQAGLAVVFSVLASSLVASMMSYRIRKRSQIINAIFVAGIVQFVVGFIAEQKSISSFLSVTEIAPFHTLINIGFSCIIIMFLPVFEHVFRVVTNISLLELLDFNHPLLKKMILEAPGTYQHSFFVANLAEAAAESVDANPLLARVGSYYHDIGKIPKSHYFVENQVPRRDVHKDLKPSISKMIIMNHVKEGVDLAKKYRLNPRIIDFIVEHHGKSLVYYFFQRAKEQEPEADHSEEEYRYPGPKPQTKETVIVMLADTIEAVSRTLDEPNPSRIQEMVQEVVKRKFIEGELDESNLTLQDLDKITHSFVRILNAIFHARINYPQDGTDKKPAKN